MVGAVQFMLKPPGAGRVQVGGATGSEAAAQESGLQGVEQNGCYQTLLSLCMRPTREHIPSYGWSRRRARRWPSWLRSMIHTVIYSSVISWDA